LTSRGATRALLWLSKLFLEITTRQGRACPVFALSTAHGQFVRAGYFLGRVECFKMGEIKKKAFYHDFTSLYPDVGRQHLPYGELEEINFWGRV
jgi:hypothetical protein